MALDGLGEHLDGGAEVLDAQGRPVLKVVTKHQAVASTDTYRGTRPADPDGRPHVVLVDANGNDLAALPTAAGLGLANITEAPYNAKADAVQAIGSITTGTNQLTLAGVTSADVGKTVYIPGAGANFNFGATGGGTAVPTAYRGKILSVAGGVATMDTTASNTATSLLCTYGTAIDTALDLAFDSGKPVYFPPGNYLMAAFHTGKSWHRVFGVGPEFVTIYWSPGFANLQPLQGTGLSGATSALTANANIGATSVAVTGTPPVVAGDYMAISSTDLWEPDGTDFDAQICPKAEIVKVQQVQGSTVYLEDPLVDTYTTAASAKIQKWVADRGDVEVSGIKFVAATTCDMDLQTTDGMNLLRYGGSIAGFACLLTFSRLKNVRLKGIEIEGHTGASVLIQNCLDWDVGHSRWRRGAQQGSYGYCVSAMASQWGAMHDCTSNHTSALYDSEGFGAVPAIPNMHMPNRWVDVNDCTVREGLHEAFLNHLCSEFTTFKDCRIHGGAFYRTEISHSAGLRSGGRNAKIIDFVAEYVPGIAMIVFGKNPTIIRPIIRNVVPDSSGVSIGIAIAGVNPGGTNALIQGGSIDGVQMTAAGVYGHGIYVYAGATGARIRNIDIRNTDGHGIFLVDTSNTEDIDGVTGVNIGSAGYTGGPTYLIAATATTPLPNWRNIRGTFTGPAGSGITNKPSGLIPVQSNGYPGLLTPQKPFYGGVIGIVGTANQAWLNRLYVLEQITINSIAFIITVAATANDNIDVGIYDAAGNRLSANGSTAGIVNSAGLKNISLTTPVTLLPGRTYWIALAYGAVGGTAATIWGIAFGSTSVAALLGAGASGNYPYMQPATSFPLPSTVTLAAPTGNTQPLLAARNA